MKKFFALAAFLLLTVCTFAQDGKSIYMKYSDEPGVSAVYISPAMFRMIGKLPDMSVGRDSMNITPIVKSLRGMYLISTENRAVANALKGDVKSFMNKGKYELLLEAKEDGEVVRMYTMSKGEFVTNFVLMAAEDSECTFICLDGNIYMKDLERLLGESGIMD